MFEMVDFTEKPNYLAELVAERQKELDEGIAWLIKQRAEWLVIRLRPLERIHLRDYPRHVDLVIVEGEQTPLHPGWVRTIRDTCNRFKCAFQFLGWGAWQPCLEIGNQFWQTMDGQLHRFDLGWLDKKTWKTWHDGVGIDLSWDEPGVMFQKVGREQSGNMLDGKVWYELPDGWIECENVVRMSVGK